MKRVTTFLSALLLLLLIAGCTTTNSANNIATPAGSSNDALAPAGSSNDALAPAGNSNDALAPAGNNNDAPTPAGNNNDAPTPATPNNQAQIYAAAIRQIYTVDHSFGESPGWPLVYVVTTTEDLAMIDGPVAPSQILPAELQAAITAGLSDQPFEVIWIASHDEAPIDPTNGQVAEGEGIIISLGNIHAQDDGSVQLPFFMTCGGLCGIGKTYVLTQVDGAWQVTGSVGPEIMS